METPRIHEGEYRFCLIMWEHAPVTAAQLGRALQSNPALSGVIVDPGGPWLHVDRADLGPVLARADEPDPAPAPAPAEPASEPPAS